MEVLEINPTIPMGVEVLFFVVPALAIALSALALVSIGRHSRTLTTTALAVWVLAVIVVPVIAPACWFAIGRPASEVGLMQNRQGCPDTPPALRDNILTTNVSESPRST